MSSFDEKIARAQKLSHEIPQAREVLDFYSKIAVFQRDISLQFNGAEHSDIRSMLRFLPQLRALVAQMGSVPLQQALSKLGDNQETWTELLLENWEPQGVRTQSPAQLFLSYLLLQPYAQHVTSRMTIAPDTSSSHCPACGNPAQLAVLREFNNGAKRSLICSLCFTEWEFLRVRCPNCNQQDKDKLPVFTAEQFQQGRIEACDNCKTYIKCIDLTKDGHAVPQVDDLATLALDLWAEEQGYTPQHHNMFFLPSE